MIRATEAATKPPTDGTEQGHTAGHRTVAAPKGASGPNRTRPATNLAVRLVSHINWRTTVARHPTEDTVLGGAS